MSKTRTKKTRTKVRKGPAKVQEASIKAEMDELVKRHGVQREEVEIKGVKQSILRWSPMNEAEADEMDACRGEMVKL